MVSKDPKGLAEIAKGMTSVVSQIGTTETGLAAEVQKQQASDPGGLLLRNRKADSL
jgi:hypothetical protein